MEIILSENDYENYRELESGEFIECEDLFQRKPNKDKFEIVNEETEIDGKKLNGLMYLRCYPVVLRRKNKCD